jgi:hypothetical protein
LKYGFCFLTLKSQHALFHTPKNKLIQNPFYFMGYHQNNKFIIAPSIENFFFILLVVLSLIATTPVKAQQGSNKQLKTPAKICNFWVGDITTIRNYKSMKPDVSNTNVKTVYHVRLREETPNQMGTEIRLINDNSKVEGEITEVDEGHYGYGNTGSHKLEGNGTAKVMDPGSNSGSAGAISLNGKGKRLQYRFDMWPDKGSEKYPVTVHYFMGDPPKENIENQSGGFRDARTKGDAKGFSSWANFTSGGLMEGEYSVPASIPGYSETEEKTSWKLHMITGPCIQSLDTTSQHKDPCGNTSNQDALLQNCLDQQKAIETDIKSLQQSQQKEAAEAKSHYQDFKLVVNLCKLWDKTKTLLIAIIGGADFAEGLSPADAAEFKEFQETIKLLTGMANNAANGKNPAEAMEPEEIKNWIEKGEKLNKLIEQIDILLAGYSPESGAKILDDCSAPIPENLQRSAEQYLNHLKASLDGLHEINKRLNDLRSKSEECQQKQWDAYKACVEHARCAGTPESKCADKKPPGNWPEIR